MACTVASRVRRRFRRHRRAAASREAGQEKLGARSTVGPGSPAWLQGEEGGGHLPSQTRHPQLFTHLEPTPSDVRDGEREQRGESPTGRARVGNKVGRRGGTSAGGGPGTLTIRLEGPVPKSYCSKESARVDEIN